MKDLEEMMTDRELAEYVRLKRKTLQMWRWRGVGPPYIKVEGAVRYRKTDVDEWFAERKRGTKNGEEDR